MANRLSRAAGEIIAAPKDDLCLTYANTRYWRGTATPTEDLNGPADLLRWAAETERLPPRIIDRFGTAWQQRPEEAASSYRDAITLREAIFRCFAATAGGRAPSDDDLGALNAALAIAPPRQRLRLGGWDVGVAEPSASVILAPTLWSAGDLLVGPQLPRVHQCANPDCGWLFLDNSKSGNRRWCAMRACGNRAKAHRHYLRQRSR